MDTWLEETTLEGNNVKLVPLDKSYRDKLVKAASDGMLWNLWYTGVPSEKSIDQYIKKAIEDKEAGVALPFVVVGKSSNQVIGSTRFCNGVSNHRRVEIGYTWYAKSFQRSSINTECKLLLLSHAFETLNSVAVEFRTHWHNHQSRNAIARLGAKQDGVMRNHMIDGDGNLRDTVVFSIVKDEWKTVKQSLIYKSRLYLS
ncbi:MAG: RimJ/RimL family protein N-acetyltransferase [Polaribacter sp.]|jgi:RimJ/RimL family protein N-acetyltransferase